MRRIMSLLCTFLFLVSGIVTLSASEIKHEINTDQYGHFTDYQ